MCWFTYFFCCNIVSFLNEKKTCRMSISLLEFSLNLCRTNSLNSTDMLGLIMMIRFSLPSWTKSCALSSLNIPQASSWVREIKSLRKSRRHLRKELSFSILILKILRSRSCPSPRNIKKLLKRRRSLSRKLRELATLSRWLRILRNQSSSKHKHKQNLLSLLEKLLPTIHVTNSFKIF